MDLARTRLRLPTPLVLLLLAVLGAYSLLYIAHLVPIIVSQPVPPDWGQHRIAAERVASGASPYFVEDWYRFRWSPVGAWIMVPITALGPWAWIAAQFAALLTLPRRLALVALLAFPFWADVQAGNVLVFTFVAAFHALRGNQWAGAAFVAMALVIPRPLVLPLLTWLAWQWPSWRIPIVVAAAASLGAAVVTGYHVDWLGMLLLTGGEETHRFGAQLLPAWPLTGIAFAVLLTVLGYPAAAGFAVQPYWLPYYGLLLLLEIRPRTNGPVDRRAQGASVAPAHRAATRAP